MLLPLRITASLLDKSVDALLPLPLQLSLLALSKDGDLSNEEDNGDSGGIDTDIPLSLSLEADDIETSGCRKSDCVAALSLKYPPSNVFTLVGDGLGLLS